MEAEIGIVINLELVQLVVSVFAARLPAGSDPDA